MNRKNNRLAWRAALPMLCMALCVSLIGCQAPEPQPGVTETETRPDLTDNRVPTSVDTYREGLSGAFEGATPVDPSVLDYEVTEGGVKITGYRGNEAVVVIPAAIDGKAVVAIGDKAFMPPADESDTETAAETAAESESATKVAITHLSIPDSVTFIGHGAFQGCDSLEVLRTPVVVAPGTVVGDDGEPVDSFGALFGGSDYQANARWVPKSLTTLILGEGLTSIPAYALYACRNLVAVDLPSTLTEIGDFAFYGCEGLVYADLSDTALKTVGTCAFAMCVELLRFDLPAAVGTVGEGVVKGCNALESMTLPFVGGRADEHTYLGFLFGATDYTLTEGHMPVSLMEVTLLPTCKTIPDNAFFGCSYLRAVHLPDGLTAVGHRAFYRCARLRAVTLPDTVTAIGNEAFQGCVRLTSIHMSNSLTTLGTQAFMRCLSLGEITLPATVTSLPASAFAGCLSLTTVIAPGVTAATQVAPSAYHNCPVLTKAPCMPNGS